MLTSAGYGHTPGGPALPQQLGVKVGMALGVFAAKRNDLVLVYWKVRERYIRYCKDVTFIALLPPTLSSDIDHENI